MFVVILIMINIILENDDKCLLLETVCRSVRKSGVDTCLSCLWTMESYPNASIY